jgi:hypothetical protein
MTHAIEIITNNIHIQGQLNFENGGNEIKITTTPLELTKKQLNALNKALRQIWEISEDCGEITKFEIVRII